MPNDRAFYVYEHWRPDRDECFYVGKGRGPRASNLKRRNRHHLAIQAKLSRLGLCVEIRVVKGGLTEKEAFDLEISRIAFWREDGADLTNMTFGGEGTSGWVPTAETLEKRRAAAVGKTRSAEWRHNISKALLGRKRPEVGLKLRGQKIHSEEGKRRLAEMAKERFAIFDQYRQLGPKASSRPVQCVDDGRAYESASAAAREYQCSKSAVIELCLGKNYRKTVNGRVFRYLEKTE